MMMIRHTQLLAYLKKVIKVVIHEAFLLGIVDGWEIRLLILFV